MNYYFYFLFVDSEANYTYERGEMNESYKMCAKGNTIVTTQGTHTLNEKCT